VQARARALELDPKRLPKGESKEEVSKLRKKPEGIALYGRLETILGGQVLQVPDEQLVEFASMLGVTMELRHLNGALVSSCASLAPPLRASLFHGTMHDS
jgi:hypothetical protein